MFELIISKLELFEFKGDNLTTEQKAKIHEALQLLKAMKNKETFEAWYKEIVDE